MLPSCSMVKYLHVNKDIMYNRASTVREGLKKKWNFPLKSKS